MSIFFNNWDTSTTGPSYLNLGTNIINGNPISVSMWIKPLQYNGSLLVVAGNNSTTNCIRLEIDGTGRVGCRVNASVNNAWSTDVLKIGQWNHVAMVIASRTDRAAFLNGGNKGTSTIDLNSTSTGQARFGSAGTTQSGFNGFQAECGVWNAALTDEEILQLSKGIAPKRIRFNNLRHYSSFLMNEPTSDGFSQYKNKLYTAIRWGANVEARPRFVPDHPPIVGEGDLYIPAIGAALQSTVSETVSIPKFTETETLNNPNIINVSNVTNSITKFTEIESLISPTVLTGVNVTNTITTFTETDSLINSSIVTNSVISISTLTETDSLIDPTVIIPSAYVTNDSFTDTAGTLLGTHIGETGADWTKYSAYTTDNVVVTAAGEIRQNGTSPANVAYYASGVSSINNVELNFSFVRRGTPFRQTIEFGARAQTAQVTYIGVRYAYDNQGWDLIKRVNNTQTTIGTISKFDVVSDVYYNCKLIVKDNILKFLVDDVEILSSTQIDVAGTGRAALRFFTAAGNTPSDTNGIQITNLNLVEDDTNSYYVHWTTPNTTLNLVNNELLGIPTAVNVGLPNLTLSLNRNFNKVFPPDPIFTTNDRIDEVKSLIYQNNTHHNKVFTQLSADTLGDYTTSAYNNAVSVSYSRTASAMEQATMYSLTRDTKYATSAYNTLKLMYDDPLGVDMLNGSGLNRATTSIAFAHVWTWCWNAFDSTQKTWMEARITDGLNAWPSFTHDNTSDVDKTSNWVGKVRGGELILILAFQDWISRSSRVTTCKNDLIKYLENYGENGYSQEGIDYASFALGTLIPAAESLKLLTGDSSIIDKCIDRKVHLQNLYRDSYSFFNSDPLSANDSYTHHWLGHAVDGYGYNASNTTSEAFFRVIPDNEKSYWKWIYDRTVGISADIPEQSKYDHSAGTGSSGRLFSLIWYDEKISTISPEGNYNKGLYDSLWGGYTFRNRWQDKNDTIIQTHAKLLYKDHAWSEPETFYIEAISNDENWFNNAQKTTTQFAPTTLTVNGLSYSDQTTTGLHEYYNFDTSANKGYSIVNGGSKYTNLGLTSAKRHLFVDFVGDGSFSIFSTLDEVSASSLKEYAWQGKVSGINSATTITMTSGTDAGIPYIKLSGRNNSYLKGWFIASNETLTTSNLKFYYDLIDGSDNIGDAFRVVTSATNTKIWSTFAQGVGTAPTATIVSGTGIDTKLAIDSRNVWYETSENRILSEANIVVVDTTVNVTKFTEVETLNIPNISSETILSIPKFTETESLNNPTLSIGSTLSIPKFTEVENLIAPTVINVSNVTNSINTLTETETLNNPTLSISSTLSIPKFTEIESLNNPSVITNVTISVSTFTETKTLNNPTLSIGSTLSIPKFTEVENLIAPTVINVSNVTNSINTLTETESLITPSILLNSTLSIPKFTETDSLNNPTVITVSNVINVINTLTEIESLINPTITTQSILSIPKFTEIESLINPSVSSGVTISVSTLTETDTLNNPSLVTVNVLSIPKFTETELIVDLNVVTGGSTIVSIPKFTEIESINNPNIITNSTLSIPKFTEIESLIVPTVSTTSNVTNVITKFTETETLNNPILSIGSVLSIAKFTEIESLVAPTVINVSNVINTITKFTEIDSLINPTLSIGSTLSITKFTETETLGVPDVIAGGNISISITTLNETENLIAPTVINVSNVTNTITKFTEVESLIVPTVIATTDVVNSISKFTETTNFINPTVLTGGNVSISIDTISSIYSLISPNILTGGSVLVSIDKFTETETLNNPDIIANSIISINKFTETETLNNPSVFVDAIINISTLIENQNLISPNVISNNIITISKFTETETLNSPLISVNDLIIHISLLQLGVTLNIVNVLIDNTQITPMYGNFYTENITPMGSQDDVIIPMYGNFY